MCCDKFWNDAGDVLHGKKNVFDAIGDVVHGVGDTIGNILKNPLPTIETIALTMVGVPPPIASAAVTALNGGKVEDIASAAIVSYAGGEIGKSVSGAVESGLQPSQGAYIPTAAESAITKIGSSAIGADAAATAMSLAKGNDFSKALDDGTKAAGYNLASSASSAVGNSAASAIDNPDSAKVAGNLASAETKAALTGQDPTKTLANSLVNSGLNYAKNAVGAPSTLSLPPITSTPSTPVALGNAPATPATQKAPVAATVTSPLNTTSSALAAPNYTAPAPGKLLEIGQTGEQLLNPYDSQLQKYLTGSGLQRYLNPSQYNMALNQNAPVFVKEGGSIQHFAGGSQGGVYGSGLDVAGMYTDPNEKDAMVALQNMSNQQDAIKIPSGALLSNDAVAPLGQQRAIQPMSVIPQLAALLQARGMHLPLRMAEGGTPDHEHPHFDGTPLFRTGGLESLGGKYVEGKGDGTSDDIAAMLANGEYVFSADVVSALGNGSNKAGAKELDQMVQAIRARARSAPPDKLPPDAKPPLEYLKSSKGKTHG